METVNNLASSASRAIWGPSNTDVNQNETAGKEPIAGETGDVKAGEPYDKGNLDSTGTEPIAGEKGDVKAGEPFDKGNLDSTGTDLTSNTNPASSTDPETKPSTFPIRTEQETSTSNTHDNPLTISSSEADKPTSSVPTTASPSSAPQDTQKQQGADRSYEAPWNDEQHERITTTKAEAEDAAKVDTSGPSPKSLEESHGVSLAGGKGGEEDGPQKESHGEGTGEKYVESSGVVADGGDFDASKPGAGKEADRLLEENGTQHTAPGKTEPATLEKGGSSHSGREGKEKVGLKDKIKDKLHIHRKSET